MKAGDQIQVEYLRSQYNIALEIVFDLDIQLDENYDRYNGSEIQAMSIERRKIRAKMLYYDLKIMELIFNEIY